MVTFEVLRSIDMFAFRFVAIGPFYRSGPTIVPKMKEIQKVVQKLSREQESAAGGGGADAGSGVRTGTKT